MTSFDVKILWKRLEGLNHGKNFTLQITCLVERIQDELESTHGVSLQ